MKVLIVDDDSFTLDTLQHTLDRLGHETMRASSGQEALDLLRQNDIRMVITDWDMPGMNGLDLCRAVRNDDINSYVYVIMLSGRDNAQSRREGISAGADDFLFKPLDADDLLVSFKTAERVLGLETRDVALFALAKLAESRDPDTGAHVERVQIYSRLLAQNLSPAVREKYGINAEFVRLLHQTSALHDLGKVAIPDSILLKPGKLTPSEFAVMQTHALLGAQTLESALERFPTASFLRMARDIALSHHERFDGSGYPCGLRGVQIPTCARIVALADVYDALVSRRVYKEAMPHEQARQFIVAASGKSFDPDVVEAFIRAESQFVAVRSQTPNESEPAGSSKPAIPARTGESVGAILVVEDSPMLLRNFTELLANTGRRIFAASNIHEAIEIFAEHAPDVVVSDWEMPGGTGLEFCQHVRMHSTGRPVHFIMLTSHSDQQWLLEAYKIGVNDFIPKPCNPEELLARVNAGIRVSELHSELARKSERLAATNAQLQLTNFRLDRLAITDELTGLFNRRHAMARFEEQWALAERNGRSFTIAAMDIDHFKRVNDTYGHEAGDEVLRAVSGILRTNTRGTDLVCRVGGEEFLILFPMQGVEEAAACVERCRLAVEQNVFNVNGTQLRTTISIGLAARGSMITHSADLLRAADKALYAAKHSGRNRISVHSDKESPMEPAPPSIEKPSHDHAKPSDRGAIDLNVIAERCGGDLQFATSITGRFKAQAPLEVRRLDDALAAKDRESFRRAAHTVKSMSAYVAADYAAGLCKQLEDLATQDRLSEVGTLVESLHSEIEQITTWIAENATQSEEAVG